MAIMHLQHKQPQAESLTDGKQWALCLPNLPATSLLAA